MQSHIKLNYYSLRLILTWDMNVFILVKVYLHFILIFTVVVSLSVSLLRLVVADRVCGLFFSYVL